MIYKPEYLCPDDEPGLITEANEIFILSEVDRWFEADEIRIRSNIEAQTAEKHRNDAAETIRKLLHGGIVIEATDGRALHLTEKKQTSSAWKEAFNALVTMLKTSIEAYEGNRIITKKAVIALVDKKAALAVTLHTGSSQQVPIAKIIDETKFPFIIPDVVTDIEIIYRLERNEEKK